MIRNGAPQNLMFEDVVSNYFQGLTETDETLRSFVHDALMLWYECGLLQLLACSRKRLVLDRHGTERRALLRRIAVLKISHLAGDISEPDLAAAIESLTEAVRLSIPSTACSTEYEEASWIDLKQLENEVQAVLKFGPTMAVPILDPVDPAFGTEYHNVIDRAAAMVNYKMKMSGFAVRLNLLVPRELAGQLRSLLSVDTNHQIENIYLENLSQCNRVTFSGCEFIDQPHVGHRVFISGTARKSLADYWMESCAAFSLLPSRVELQWVDPRIYSLLQSIVLFPESSLSDTFIPEFRSIRERYGISKAKVAEVLGL